jgi:thymidylate kinase
MLVLSGLDGTGKSTQAGILAGRLAEQDVETSTVWNRWSPAFTAPLIKAAKKRISPRPDAATEEYTDFTRSKRERMRSPLKRSLWQAMVWSEYTVQVHSRLLGAGYPRRAIISDRYVYDTLVDMAVNFSLEPEDLGTLCSHALLSLFPVPASFVVIDIDPETGSKRKSDGTPPEYLADRRPFYLEIARLTGAAVVDGNGTIEETAAGIWEGCSRWRENLIKG